tara:strand:- start:49 stop:588 length:540 start_codon:yes stop_codon:yes gene_type:complete
MENELKHSIQYINNKVRKKTGFSAPTDYFDNLQDSIQAKLAEESFSKKSAFKVPENYFDTLENNVLGRISSEVKETKVISFKERIFKMIPIAAAASIILFIGLNSFVFNTSDEITLDSLSNNDIEYWLDTNTFHSSDISTVYEDDILDENEFLFNELEDESIEDYISLLDDPSLLNELN